MPKNKEETITNSDLDLHIPVLYNELLDSFIPDANNQDIIVDWTLWLWGHALWIIDKLKSWDIFIWIDQDASNLKLAWNNISSLAESKNVKIYLVHDNFQNIENILINLDIKNINYAYLDLWISSVHVDDASRWFSHRFDAKLDMRLDLDNNITAEKIINKSKETKLIKIFREYSEEPKSYKIAKKIISCRKQKKIKTTFELKELIFEVWWDIKTVTRIFQALRIEVNKELESIQIWVRSFIKVLKKEWVLFVISFHSLEDRIVKRIFQEYSKYIPDPITWQVLEPAIIKRVNKKPIIPSGKEINKNKRSRSAKARIIKKII